MMLVALGILAGVVTTVAGMGGGMLLVLALSAGSGDPLFAVAVTTPALLVGNLHRVGLFRRDIDWRRALLFMGAAGPGAFVGGALALGLPPWLLQVGMAAAAGLAVSRYTGLTGFTLPSTALVPSGFGIGVASTAGGAGALAGPLLLSTGLSGPAYLATMSLGSLSMHLGRLLAFGADGLLTPSLWQSAGILAACLVVGNQLGRQARVRLGERRVATVEVATAVGLVTLALAGVVRLWLQGVG